MNIKERIDQNLKQAMRARESKTVSALRLITAAMKQIEVDERIELDNDRILALLDKLSKQRQEAIDQYAKADRQDLVEQEQFELDLIKEYLPEALSQDEVNAFITEAFYEVNPNSMQDMGKVMAYLKPKLLGRVDMSQVSRIIKEKLL